MTAIVRINFSEQKPWYKVRISRIDCINIQNREYLRFCDAKRYWCSENVVRPIVTKFSHAYDVVNSRIEHYANTLGIAYADVKNNYYIFDISDEEYE